MKQKFMLTIGCILAISLMNTISYGGEGSRYYEVIVTNMTRGQTFTPILVATHGQGVELFTPGSPASEDLAILAEGGDTVPLEESLLASPKVGSVATSEGLLGPGESTTLIIPYKREFRYISLAAMLVPTNDAFFALQGVQAARWEKTKMYLSPAYDAGSEMNDELCENIPGGGGCAGEGYNSADGEGYVHIHAGIHGIGDLNSDEYDWRNPVAKIVVKEMSRN